MESVGSEKVISELNNFIATAAKGSRAVTHESGLAEAVINGDLNDADVRLLAFEESANVVWNQVENIFSMAVNYDLLSDHFMNSCRMLDKGVRFLGSAWLTKYALEYNGKKINTLQGLEIEHLGRMVSCLIRKCDTAINQCVLEKQTYPMDLFNMLLNFANLLERLRATKDKSENFYLNKKLQFKYACPGEELREEKGAEPSAASPASEFRKAPSLPVMKDILSCQGLGEARDQNPETSERHSCQGLGESRDQNPETSERHSCQGLGESSDQKPEGAADRPKGELTLEQMKKVMEDPDLWNQYPILAGQIMTAINWSDADECEYSLKDIFEDQAEDLPPGWV